MSCRNNQAIIISKLREYNQWRRGDDEIKQPDPFEIGAYIDDICDIAENIERQLDEARARLHPDRALEWLRVHYQSWFGDRTEWSDDISDRFYKDTATLTLFCQNFKFSKEVAK